MLFCRAMTSRVISFLENLRIEMVGPSMASGGMMMLTRLPSLRRASTSGVDSSTRRPTSVTMRVATCRTCGSSRKTHVGQLDLALALDVDLMRAVDHDVGHALVVEQRLERAEADHVVDEEADDRLQLGGVQLDLEVDDDLLDDLGDLLAQLLRAERRGDRDVDALHEKRHDLLLDLHLALVLRLGRDLGAALGQRVDGRFGRAGASAAPWWRRRRRRVRRAWHRRRRAAAGAARRGSGAPRWPATSASSTSLAVSASCSGVALASPSGPSAWRSRSLAAERSMDERVVARRSAGRRRTRLPCAVTSLPGARRSGS